MVKGTVSEMNLVNQCESSLTAILSLI